MQAFKNKIMYSIGRRRKACTSTALLPVALKKYVIIKIG